MIRLPQRSPFDHDDEPVYPPAWWLTAFVIMLGAVPLVIAAAMLIARAFVQFVLWMAL